MSLSSPMKRAVISGYSGRLLLMASVPPAAATSWAASSARPRGSLSQSGSAASKPQTRRGVFQVEKR
jgi:hypothetical protein